MPENGLSGVTSLHSAEDRIVTLRNEVIRDTFNLGSAG